MSLIKTTPLLLAIGVLGGTMNPTITSAEALPPEARRSAPPHAESRCDVRGDSVWLDGTRVWPARKTTALEPRIVSPLTWSTARDAIAFVTQTSQQKSELVILVLDRGNVTPLSWALPFPARAVTWVGPTKVAVGPTAFEPRASVSYARLP
jgi:hypothetical protein